MSKAVQVAQGLIKKHNLKPGFEIEDLVKKLGIELKISSLESMSGFAYQKEGRKVIGVNEDESSKRQRFTIAHELGHMLMHGENDVQFDNKNEFVYFRDDNSTTGLSPKEVEANAFAAELLMPSEKLRSKIATLGGIDMTDDDTKVEKLAKEFGVSFTAMSVRLSTLLQAGHSTRVLF